MTLDEKTVKVPKMIDETTHTVPISKDTTGYDMEIKEEGSYYILIPFGVFLFIIILSLLASGFSNGIV